MPYVEDILPSSVERKAKKIVRRAIRVYDKPDAARDYIKRAVKQQVAMRRYEHDARKYAIRRYAKKAR